MAEPPPGDDNGNGDTDDNAGNAGNGADQALARDLFAGECTFLLGATSIATLPVHEDVEVAFAGRSNVGKSSLLNALVGRQNMARTSKEPGRTRELNFFRVEGRDGSRPKHRVGNCWLEINNTTGPPPSDPVRILPNGTRLAVSAS